LKARRAIDFWRECFLVRLTGHVSEIESPRAVGCVLAVSETKNLRIAIRSVNCREMQATV
jgi:hypothetical protein